MVIRAWIRIPDLSHHCGIGDFRRFISIYHTVVGRFLLWRVSTLTRDIDIANLSVRLSVYPSVSFRYAMETRQHIVVIYSPLGSPVILVSEYQTSRNSDGVTPALRGRLIQVGYKNFTIFEQ